jgi:uncharacterized protein
MRKFTFLLCVLFGGILPLSAQQSLAEAAARAKTVNQGLPQEAPAREQVLKLLDLLRVRKSIEIMFAGIKEQARNGAEQGFRSKVPNPTPQQTQQLHALIDDMFSEMSVDEVIETIIPVYQRHLTKSDIDGVTAFYTSAVGQKLLREQPAMMQESMQAAGARQQQRMEALMKKLDNRINQMVEEGSQQAPKQ